MALVNHAKKEINAKLVYYGPSGSGKGASLHYIYSRIKPSLRGELKNVSAGGDCLLFFDFSPFELPLADGYRLRLHVYTLTGPVTNPATWKMTLKGADGLVVMVDRAAGLLLDARESVSELRGFLSAYGVGLQDIPAVLQLNSSETETVAGDTSQIAQALDLPSLTLFRSNVANGEGVLDALSALSRMVLDRVIDTEKRFAVMPEAGGTVVDDCDEYEGTSEFDDSDYCTPALPTESGIAGGIGNRPQISVISEDIGIEGTVLRIPINISCGDACRRLLVTVSVDSL